VIELLGHLLLLAPVSLILLWLSWPYFSESFIEGEESSNAGGLPVWPAKFLIFAGVLLLCMQMVSEVIKRGAVLGGRIAEPAAEPVHGHAPSDTSRGGAHPE
jgi:TRAP-type mannitol/chloroaromatic compound transport system permease small subunit